MKRLTTLKFWQKKPKEIITVFTFHTVSEVLQFERGVKAAGFSVTLKPVPRSVSSSCGTCAVIDPKDEEAIVHLVEEKNLKYHEIHTVED